MAWIWVGDTMMGLFWFGSAWLYLILGWQLAKLFWRSHELAWELQSTRTLRYRFPFSARVLTDGSMYLSWFTFVRAHDSLYRSVVTFFWPVPILWLGVAYTLVAIARYRTWPLEPLLWVRGLARLISGGKWLVTRSFVAVHERYGAWRVAALVRRSERKEERESRKKQDDWTIEETSGPTVFVWPEECQIEDPDESAAPPPSDTQPIYTLRSPQHQS
ncbi:MAG: hypothetical protein Q7R83_03870 [bacterium]|nr:hypothetical protein [bacterium]